MLAKPFLFIVGGFCGVMASALHSGSIKLVLVQVVVGVILCSWARHCISHGASLYSGVQMCAAKFNTERNLLIDKHLRKEKKFS